MKRKIHGSLLQSNNSEKSVSSSVLTMMVFWGGNLESIEVGSMEMPIMVNL